MAHRYITRTLSIVHMCALLAVVATLAVVLSHATIGAVSPGVCEAGSRLASASVALDAGCAQDGPGTPVGYRTP